MSNRRNRQTNTSSKSKSIPGRPIQIRGYLTFAGFPAAQHKRIEIVDPATSNQPLIRGKLSKLHTDKLGVIRVLILDDDWRTGLSAWIPSDNLGLLTNDGKPTTIDRRCRLAQ